MLKDVKITTKDRFTRSIYRLVINDGNGVTPAKVVETSSLVWKDYVPSPDPLDTDNLIKIVAQGGLEGLKAFVAENNADIDIFDYERIDLAAGLVLDNVHD